MLHNELRGQEVIVVSNREPYIHMRKGDAIEVRRPASGLVTALEPIMRACSGTWIAHGSGSADRDVVDRHNRIEVPPGQAGLPAPPRLADQGGGGRLLLRLRQRRSLAALSHRARPADVPDRRTGRSTCASIASSRDAVVKEATSPDPIVLVQDYHLALLPRMVREALPDATIITFWHIPWPNPEAFAICPWREELLDGLLGSSILGFHTQFHCNNFVDTVDRQLEAQGRSRDVRRLVPPRTDGRQAISDLDRVAACRPI